jgi:hypothetical protein
MVSFNQEFANTSTILNQGLLESTRDLRPNLVVWNRSHIGEFVYGNLYRNTDPESWVIDLEYTFHYHERDDIYLLLLTTSPEFSASKDDGKSFASTATSRMVEIDNFRHAFKKSTIKKKLELCVEKDGKYIPQEEIVNTVMKFLNS